MTAVENSGIQAPAVGPDIAVAAEQLRGEGFISATALSALETYSQATSDPRAYEHPLRVANILHDFVGQELSDNIYDAAALHDIGQRATSDWPERRTALASLHAYGENIGEEDDGTSRRWVQVSTLLADMDRVEDCSQHGRRLDTGNAIVSGLLRSRLDVPVPKRAWEIRSGLVALNRIEELLQNVNLESALIKAAEMLDNLRHPAPNDRAVLQDVFDAESFYAPLCEAMGFDGLSMALRSEATIIRLRKGSYEDNLDEARGMLDVVSDREQVLTDVSGLFQHLLGGETIVETPLRNVSKHGIQLGNVVLHAVGLNESNNASWAHWRIKSLGSLALKLGRPGEKPADILGVTIVVPDLDELAVTFRGIVERIRANRIVEERSSPSRAQAFSVQGSEAYIAAVLGGLDGSKTVGETDVHRFVKDNGHQVAKATFVYKPHVINPQRPETEIPVELVVQREEDWLAARWGNAAHILYKVPETVREASDHTLIRSIYERRAHLKSGGLNPRSMDGGKQLRAMAA